MPAGRLTPRERRRIARGVADGLAYAEIARGLGRPTSTVSREVRRNGGPTAYRADRASRSDRALRAAEHRAPARAYGRDTGAGRAYGAVRAYEEQCAAVLIRSGLPRMPARALAGLCTTDEGALTASELVGRLRVSPASVSKAIAFLEGRGLVRRERDGRRRERYLIDDDALYRATIAAARGTEHLGVTARQGVHVLGPGTPAGARLEIVARFVDFVAESLARAADQARAARHPWPATPPDGTG
ncbi:helix-turn-helix domain-containing protein [Streptomyces sp. NPDC058623]|uniref:helix-turn-helix domain-containing protein n=1 Tax=Streptomyces sp. NPDC058623 TaxID=3346563 RepID=UPI0036648D95